MNKRNNLNEEFVRTIAHDMKAKLTSMLAYTQLLKRKLPQENTDALRFLNNIESHIKMFAINITDITDLIKYKTTRCKFDKENILLDDLLSLSIEYYQKNHPEISIHKKYSILPTMIYIDNARMQKAIDNLLTFSILNLKEIHLDLIKNTKTITIYIKKLYTDFLTKDTVPLDEIKYLVAESIIKKHQGNLKRTNKKKLILISISLPFQ